MDGDKAAARRYNMGHQSESLDGSPLSCFILNFKCSGDQKVESEILETFPARF